MVMSTLLDSAMLDSKDTLSPFNTSSVEVFLPDPSRWLTVLTNLILWFYGGKE